MPPASIRKLYSNVLQAASDIFASLQANVWSIRAWRDIRAVHIVLRGE